MRTSTFKYLISLFLGIEEDLYVLFWNPFYLYCEQDNTQIIFYLYMANLGLTQLLHLDPGLA